MRGFYDPAAACIHLPGVNNRIENVRIEQCPQETIFVGSSGVVENCQIANSSSGINTDGASLVRNNAIFDADNFCIMTYGGGAASGGVVVSGNTCNSSTGNGRGILVNGPGNRIEGNVITGTNVGIDLDSSTGSFFARNILQGNATAIQNVGANDVDGGTIDASLSNITIP